MNENQRLQESRKKSIPDLVAKYKKLVDETFHAVTKPLPAFEDRTNERDEVMATAEQQLFSFIDIRNKALDNANRMLEKVNQLEIELYAPEIFENDLKEKVAEVNTVEPVKRSWTKAKAAEHK